MVFDPFDLHVFFFVDIWISLCYWILCFRSSVNYL